MVRGWATEYHYCFFFSSRRRHTRFDCDWSSDVCSSDLGGLGAHSVLECVGLEQSTATALGIVRAGGAVGRVGVPQNTTIPLGDETFYKNAKIGRASCRERV